MPTLDELRRRFRKKPKPEPEAFPGTVPIKLKLKTTGSDGKPLITEEALLAMKRMEEQILAGLGLPSELVVPTLEHAKSGDAARIAEAIYQLADQAGIGLGPAAVAMARTRAKLADPWPESLLERVKAETRNGVKRHRWSYPEVERAIGGLLNEARSARTPRADTDLNPWCPRRWPHEGLGEAVHETTSTPPSKDWLKEEFVVKTFSTTASVKLHGRGKVYTGTTVELDLTTPVTAVPAMLVDRLYNRWKKSLGTTDPTRSSRTYFEHDVASATVQELGRRNGLKLTTDRCVIHHFEIRYRRETKTRFLVARLLLHTEDANRLIEAEVTDTMLAMAPPEGKTDT